MKFNDIIFTEFLRFNELWEKGNIPIFEFAQNIEILVENMEGKIPHNEFILAMDKAHNIEIINAIILSEMRQPYLEERKEISEEFAQLKEIIFRNIENYE